MASSIDDTKPDAMLPTTTSVRSNFATAKSEITSIQTDITALQAGKTAVSDLASTATDDGTKGYHLVSYPPLSGESGVTDSEYWYGDVRRYGAIPDSPSDDDSAAIRAAIATGFPVLFEAKRYIYDSVTITDDVITLVGARMPKINAGFTALENGTIIEGSLKFSGTNVNIKDLGVDLGSAGSAAAGDCIKATAPIGTGKHLHLENVVGLGKASSDAFHAILAEGFELFTGSNIIGAHNYFSFVIKCTNVTLSSIYGYRSSSDGLYLKADASFGVCERVNITGLNIDGNSVQTFGLRIQSAGAVIGQVNITDVHIKDCLRSYKCDVNGTSGENITEVNINNFTSIGCTTRDIDIACDRAGKAIYAHSMSNVKILDTVLEGIKASGVGSLNHITFNDVFISYVSGASTAQIEAGGIQIGSTVLNSMMDLIVVCRGYSTSTPGGIVYTNATTNNRLGVYQAVLSGSGIPTGGFSTPNVTGTTYSLTIPDNWKARTSVVKCSLFSGDATINVMNHYQYGTTLFETGHELTLINNSGNDLTVAHNFGGKILLEGGLSVVIGTNVAKKFVFGGAVWHEII